MRQPLLAQLACVFEMHIVSTSPRLTSPRLCFHPWQAQERDPLAKYNSLRAHKLQAENRQDIAAMERTSDQMR